MVEAFAEHLHLDNAVEGAVSKRCENSRLFVLPLLAVNNVSGEAALLIERADLSGMVD